MRECVYVCMCVREKERERAFLTLGGKPAPSALGYRLQKVEIKHIKPSVLYLLTNKRKKRKWQKTKMADMQNKLNQTINQSINQWEGGQESVQASGAQ